MPRCPFPLLGPLLGEALVASMATRWRTRPSRATYRQETTVAGHMQTQIYHMPLLHRAFAQPFNVVIIVQTTLRTQDRAHLVLCSSDLALASALLLDSYALRCPLEFHFREAKQYWGLEDVMNVTLTGVTHAANVSLCRVNVAYCLRKTLHPGDADYSVLDLKADYRGDKYVEETIKMLPDKPEPVLCAKILHKVACLGRIHAVQPSFSFS